MQGTLAGLADLDLRFARRGADLDREAGPDAAKQRRYSDDIPQIDSRLMRAQGKSVPGGELRTVPGGPFPASTDRNGRPYLPDSAKFAH
jgi:hypothetical protein